MEPSDGDAGDSQEPQDRADAKGGGQEAGLQRDGGTA